jgi:hypothetical protein
MTSGSMSGQYFLSWPEKFPFKSPQKQYINDPRLNPESNRALPPGFPLHKLRCSSLFIKEAFEGYSS